MSSSKESKGRKSRRVAAQQNASGKEGIPAKKDMTVEELADGDSMCCCMGIGPLWARSEGSGNVQSSGGSSNDTQREQREIARISRHQHQHDRRTR